MINYQREQQQTIPDSEVIIVGVGGAGANMIERYTPQYGSNVTGEMIREVKERSKQRLTNIAEETLKGSRIICSTLYKVGAEYEYHVCVELTDVNLPRTAYNKLSSDEKLILDYGAENFKEDMDKELEKLRKRKQQGL